MAELVLAQYLFDKATGRWNRTQEPGFPAQFSHGALHPRIAIVLVSDRASERSVGNFHVVDRRRSAQRLLRELELAYLELAAPPQTGD